MNTMVFELKIAILGTTVYNLFRTCELEDRFLNIIQSSFQRDKEVENVKEISGDMEDRMRHFNIQ